jgi:hypothetical protein
MEAPKIEYSILKQRVSSLWPSYISERRTTFAKAYGTKPMCYWELFMEHVWNLGTHCFNQWTVHSPHQTQLEKKTPPSSSLTKNERGPNTPFFVTHKK